MHSHVMGATEALKNRSVKFLQGLIMWRVCLDPVGFVVCEEGQIDCLV